MIPLRRTKITRPGLIKDPKHALFAHEFVIDFNETQAAIRAGYSPRSAATTGSQLLRDPQIQKIVVQQLTKRMDNLQVQQNDVARYWLDLAQADARELNPVHFGPCRYCHGVDHQYQFTLNQFRKAQREHLAAQLKLPQAQRVPFDEQGGIGFNRTLDPDQDCPECNGLGEAVPVAPDFKNLSRGALLLFEGIKWWGGKLEIKMRDRSRAMENFQVLMGFVKTRRPIQVVDFADLSSADLDKLLASAANAGFLPPATLRDAGVTVDAQFEDVTSAG